MPAEQERRSGSDLPRKSEAEQRAFFDRVRDRALAAERALGTLSADIELVGRRIRLLFAGAALHDALLPALSHRLVETGGEADLTVRLWDSETSGVAMAPAPVPTACFTSRGDIWTMTSRRIRSSFNFSENALHLLDADRREGLFWARSEPLLPSWVRAAPLRPLLHWWLEALGGQLLHAAAVGTEDGGVLITGRGGAGKSTTALNCLKAGMRFAGDDYVAVTLDPPTAHSLYCTAKVDRATSPGFASLLPHFHAGGREEKGIIQLAPDHPSVVRSIPLKAILTPEFAGEERTSFADCDRDRMRDAASFTTIAQLPHAGQQTLDFVDRLLDALPRRLLRLGSDRAAVPAALAAFLAAPAQVPEADELQPAPAPEPLISVVIPVFNGAHFVADAVESVLGQEHEALEIIVVDDGSYDDVEAAVAALPVDLRLIKQRNQGPAAARNAGIREASGTFIAFLDVDDLWPARRLKAMVEAFRADPSLDVVTGHAQLAEYDAETREWRFVGDPTTSFPYYIQAALFRRRAFERVGLFDERLQLCEDSDWFVRAGEAGLRIERLETTTVRVRRHDRNMTFGKTETELHSLRMFKNVLDRHRGRAAGATADAARKPRGTRAGSEQLRRLQWWELRDADDQEP